ncbi:MAG: hypothetical protein Q6366_004615, partial [Candidatus Freyarchaeota archaeon]
KGNRRKNGFRNPQMEKKNQRLHITTKIENKTSGQNILNSTSLNSIAPLFVGIFTPLHLLQYIPDERRTHGNLFPRTKLGN